MGNMPTKYESRRDAYPCGTITSDGDIACIGMASFVRQHHLGLIREVFHCFLCGNTWNTSGDPVEKFNRWAVRVEKIERKRE